MGKGRYDLPIILLIGSVGLLVAGCAVNHAQVPYAATYPATDQQKMQAGHHWDVLAGIEAENIMESLPEATSPLVIYRSISNNSAFAAAYYEFLLSQLVKKGATVLDHDTRSATHLSYDIKVLTHKDRGYIAPPRGAHSAVAGSGALVYWAATATNPGWAVIPIAAGADIFSGGWAAPEPTEVVITTKITEGGRYLMSDSRIYYINDGDTSNYRAAPPPREPKPDMPFKVVDN